MIKIIGVKFRKPGKVYYFDPTGFTVQKGDHVIVETARGVEYGTVVLGPKEVTDDQVVQPLKPLMRVATEEDAAVCASNEEKEKDAFQICLEKIKKHGLEMKLIDSEYTFDRNKLLFYFTADGRIDFRELVKDLASVFHTRIELRQIGVRDETKMLGGIAICGRPLCCHSYLSDFVPVSIKMAKEQNLSLNPAKISGVCGRLMCCLKNEQEAYEHLNRSLPHIGTKTTTPEGYPGEVQSVSVLRQLVKVVFTNDNGEKEVREYPVAELQFDQKKNFGKNIPQQTLPDEKLDEEELIALEELSQEEELIDEEDKPEQAKRNRNNRSNNRRRSSGNRRNEYPNNRERGSNNNRERNGNSNRDHGGSNNRESNNRDHNNNGGRGNRNNNSGDKNNNDHRRDEHGGNDRTRKYHNRKPRRESREHKDAE